MSLLVFLCVFFFYLEKPKGQGVAIQSFVEYEGCAALVYYHAHLCGLNGRYRCAICLKSLYGHPCAIFCSSWKSRVTSFNTCGICPDIVPTSCSWPYEKQFMCSIPPLLPKCLLNYLYIIMCMCCSQEVQDCRVHGQMMLSVHVALTFTHGILETIMITCFNHVYHNFLKSSLVHTKHINCLCTPQFRTFC